MIDLTLQFLGFVLLSACVSLGYRRWVRPDADRIGPQGRGLLLLIVLTFSGGLIGSPFWWFAARQSFSWTLPPLASRMLASAGWSFAAACFLCLRRPTMRRVKLILLMTCVYLAPLVAAILLFHLDRFDFGAPVTYAFFLIAGGMSAAVGYFLVRQPVILRDEGLDSMASAAAVRAWLGLLAVMTGVWGLALFASDSGPLPMIWVWPGDVLTSRLIGSMLVTIAAGAAYSLRWADAARMMLYVSALYGLGLAGASAWNLLLDKPAPISYGFAFGAVCVVSASLLAVRPVRGKLGL
jgi:hypothetical protein